MVQKNSVYAMVLILVIVAIGWHLSHSEKPTAKPLTQECIITAKTCDTALGEYRLAIQFDRPPEIEEAITVRFASSSDVVVEGGYIEGVNMFMGKIPIIIDRQSTGQQSAWFLLGSCSEPTMQWRMVISIKDRPEPVYAYFTTTR